MGKVKLTDADPDIQQAQFLLEYVDNGDERQVKNMMDHRPEFLFKRITFTDHCGRVFKTVSPWQLMLWSLDPQMWFLVVTKIDIKFYNILRRQLNQLNEKGLKYKLDGKTIEGESRFDFQPTLDAYGATIKELSLHIVNNRHNVDKLWCVVGKHQRIWPAYIKQMICGPQNFSNPKRLVHPTYNVPRKCSLKYRGALLPKAPEGLGVDFAIGRGSWDEAKSGKVEGGFAGEWKWPCLEIDAHAIDVVSTALYKRFENLTRDLKNIDDYATDSLSEGKDYQSLISYSN